MQIQKLTTCIRELLAAIQAGNGEEIGKHLKHVVNKNDN